MTEYKYITPGQTINIVLNAKDLWMTVLDMRDRYDKAIITHDRCELSASPNHNVINVFLDDLRKTSYVDPDKWHKWTVVRSYNEFRELMDTHPTIHRIALDHDIASYTPLGKERTGLDCFRYMKEKILSRKMSMPYELTVHSDNSNGAKNILAEWDALQANLERWRAIRDS